MSMQSLIIDGVDITSKTTPGYGVYVDVAQSHDKPKKNVEAVSIPGRNGDLIIDYDTFQNVTITYPCLIRGADALDRYQDLITFLANMKGYKDIRCSADPAHFREGVFISQQAPTVKRQGNDVYFDLAFNCKPQRFVYPEVWENIPSGGLYINDLLTTCKPIFKLVPTSPSTNPGGTITIRYYASDEVTVEKTEVITLTGPFGVRDIYIDCETMETYGVTSLGPDEIRSFINRQIAFNPNEYPVFHAGQMVSIEVSGNFNTQQVNVREWAL